MAIDIALVLVLCFGIYKGYSKGLIISIFAALAWILGVMVAMHFVAYGTSYLQKVFHSQSVYLSFLSFFIIFIVIVIVIYFIGKLLERIIDVAQLGLINKISGAVLISAVYIFLFSTLLWVCSHAGFITPEMKMQSKTYNLVEPISEEGAKGLSAVFPAVKSTYNDVGKLLDKDTMSLSKH